MCSWRSAASCSGSSKLKSMLECFCLSVLLVPWLLVMMGGASVISWHFGANSVSDSISLSLEGCGRGPEFSATYNFCRCCLTGLHFHFCRPLEFGKSGLMKSRDQLYRRAWAARISLLFVSPCSANLQQGWYDGQIFVCTRNRDCVLLLATAMLTTFSLLLPHVSLCKEPCQQCAERMTGSSGIRCMDDTVVDDPHSGNMQGTGLGKLAMLGDEVVLRLFL